MSAADGVRAEHTLLIDPCFDDPAHYLGYDPTGQIFPLGDNPYGEATIDVFHLLRRRLTNAQRKIIEMVTGVMKLIADSAPTAARDDLGRGLLLLVIVTPRVHQVGTVELFEAGRMSHPGLPMDDVLFTCLTDHRGSR